MPNNEDLPSINDYLEDSSLPSYKDFLEEEAELPSVEDFKTYKEEAQTIEDADGKAFLEVTDVVPAPEWSELVRLVNDVRKDIPQIPEIKYYDDQLAEIVEQINNIQKNVDDHGPRLNAIDLLSERIEEVNESIPTFPDWVRKVEEIPDFSWIGKSFSLFEVNFKRVQSNLDVIRENFDRKVENLSETIDVKEFESKVDIKALTENLDKTNQTLKEQRESILEEYKDTVTKLYEFRDTFKDDDKKLKKSIASEQNKLKQSIESQLNEINESSVKADETILKFYTDLKEEMTEQFGALPEVKYYDDDITRLEEDIKSLKKKMGGLENLSLKKDIVELKRLAEEIKTGQSKLEVLDEEIKEVQEGLLNQPPSELQTAGDQTDPLTPLDQKFATLDDLQAHYRLFINRITQQLSTLGGGGSVWLWDLQDVNIGAPTNGTYPPVNNGDLLMFDASTSTWVGVASTAVNNPDDTGLDDVLSVGNTSSLGFSVGPSTITQLTISGTTVGVGSTFNALLVEGNTTIDGNLHVIGTITKQDITELDSLGLVTARSGIDIGYDPVQTQFFPDGDGIMSGILTVADLNVQNHSTFDTVEATGDVTIPEGDLILGLTTVTSTAAEINTLDGVTAGTVSPNKAVVVDADKDISGFRNVTLQGWLIAPILDISGNVDIDGITNLDVVDIDGDTHIDASLDVTGQTTLDNLNVSGVTTFSGTLDLDGDVDIDGHLEVDNLNVSGVSTFASPADFNSDVDIDGQLEVDDLNVSGIATFAGTLDLNGDVDIDGHLEVDNLNVSGVSTFALTADFNGDVDIDGQLEADDINVSGVSTLQGDVSFGSSAYFTDNNRILMGNSEEFQIWRSTDAGGNSIIQNATGELQLRSNTIRLLNANTDENFAYFNDDGSVDLYYDDVKKIETTEEGVLVSGGTTTGTLSVTGVSTFTDTVDMNGDLDVDGQLEADDLNVSGVGTITTLKLNTGVSVNAIFDEDDMSSDSSGALATQQSIKAYVGLTSNAMDLDFSGDTGSGRVGLNTQVMSIDGTSGEIETSVVGTGVTIGLTQDVVIRRDLEVLRNLNVVGNVTIGGTGASLIADTLQVTDADIILGFTTDASGNNVSNDTTANHGGIAIASTEGTPLVTIEVAGIDTLPPTYKKFMWFKKNTFTGLATDTFMMNYGLAVGTTAMGDGTRLAVGDNIQMSDSDIFGVRNLNATGIITAATLIGNLTGGNVSGNFTGDINSSGISTFVTVDINGDVDIDGQTELDDVNVTGVATFSNTVDFNGDIDIDGHLEIDELNVSGVATFASNVDMNADLDVDGHTELDDINVSGLSTFQSDVDFKNNVDIDGSLVVKNLSANGVNTITGTMDFNGDVDVDGHTELDNLNVTGVATFSNTIDFNGDIDIDGHLEVDDINVSGVLTAATAFITGDFDVDGTTNLDAVDIDGNANIAGNVLFSGGATNMVLTDNTAGALDIKEGTTSYMKVDTTNESEKISIGVTFDVTGQTNLNNLEVSGVTTFSGTLDLNGDVDIDGHLEVDNLGVAGVSTFASAVDINSTLDVSGQTELDDVNISGIATFAGTLDLNGDVDIDGHLEVDNLNVSGVSTFASAVDINSTLDVSGQTELDDVNISGIATFAGTLDLNGDVDIDGHLEVDNLNVSGVSTFASPVDINSTLDVSGQTELDDVNISGIATFAGTLDLNGDVDIDGHLEVDNLNVSGVSTFAGLADFNSNVDIDGQLEVDDLNVTGIATFGGTLDFDGDVDIDGHLEVDNVNVSGVSTFAGAADFNSDVDIDGHLEVDNINVTGIATFGGTLDFDGDVDIDGHLEVDNVNVSGVATFQGDTQIGVNTNQTLDLNSFIDGNLIPASNQTFNIGNNNNKWNNLVANNATLSVLNMGSNIHLNGGNSGIITATSFSGSGNNLTGIVTNIVAGANISVDQGQGEVTITGLANTANVVADTLVVSGITTLGSDNGIGTVTIGTGSTALYVDGNARVTGILTIGTGSITLDGDNDMIYVGSGVTIMSTGEAEYTGVVTASGGFVSNGDILIKGAGSTTTTTDYSEVTLSSLSPSSFNLTYDRQATGFVLDTGTVASGNALFHADSNFYYYVATSGGFNTGRILIWSVEDNNWVVLLNIGEDYTEGNVTNNEAVGSVAGTATVTATSQTEDGRSVPQASSNIVYASSSSSTAGVGVATLTSDGDAQFTGIVTASGGFVGDLTGTLQTAAQPNITSVGTLSAVTVSGDITANGNIAGDNSTNITGIDGVTASTLTGTLQTAAQPNITSVGTLSSLDVTGNLSIGGTLTYEDVTNVDAVGMVTAGQGLRVTAGGAVISGVVTANNFINVTDGLFSTGVIQSRRTSSTDEVFKGQDSSSNTTSYILGTGAAYFNGKVGIGTDNPADKLSIYSAPNSLVFGAKDTTRGNHIFQLLANNPAGDGELRLYKNSGSGTHEKTVEIASSGVSYFNGGDVGIGEDDPATKLHVAGDITIANGSEQNAIRTNSAGQLQFLRNAAVNNQVVMTLDDNNGNVGIGTDDPLRQLEVFNTGHATAALKGDTQSSLFFVDSGDSNIGQISYLHADNYMYFRVNDAERVRITSGGVLAVGATSATGDEIIRSTGSNSGGSGIFIQNSNGATNSSADLWFGNWSGSSTGTPQARIQAVNTNAANASTALAFWTYSGTSAAEHMRIGSNGNVGIKTTNIPHSLCVNGNIQISRNANLRSDASDGGFRIQGGSTFPGGTISLSGGQGTDNIIFSNSGASVNLTERMRITSGGQSIFMKTVNNSDDLLFGYGTSAGIYAGIGGYNNFNTNQLCDLTFWTNGSTGSCAPSERMRITSDGKIGIGTITPNATLQVAGNQPETWCHDYTAAGNASNNGAAFIISRDNDDTLQTDDRIGRVRWRGQASDAPFIGAEITAQLTNGNTNRSNTECELQFGTMASGETGALTKMTLTSSGNLGIGEDDPQAKLTVRDDSSSAGHTLLRLENLQTAGSATECNMQMWLNNSNSNNPGIQIGAIENGADAYADIVFQTTPQSNSSTMEERMRITASGKVGINESNPGAMLDIGFDSSVNYGFILDNSNQGTSAQFKSGGSLVGSITVTSTATSYNETSDYRLKENVNNLGGAIDRVKQLSPKRFNFIADPDNTVDGFLAHEVSSVVPEAVSGEKDEVDSNNDPVLQMMDKSKLVPLLTAALQEAIAKIEVLEAEVTALKG